MAASLEGPERGGWTATAVARMRPRSTLIEPLLGRARRLWLRLARPPAVAGDASIRLDPLLRAAVDFVWESDAELRIVRIADAAHPFGDRAIPVLLGRRWSELPAELGEGDPDPYPLVAPRHAPAEAFSGAPFRDLRCSFLDETGLARTLEVSGVPLLDGGGRVVGYRGTAREVSERARMEQQLRHLAGHDPLTGAANRRLLEVAFARAVATAAATGCRVALIVVDLDGFKQVNDALGHGAGDAVLCALVRRLRQGLTARDLVARLGGDEFALLLGAVQDSETLGPRLAAIRDRLAEPLAVQGVTVSLRASCGMAVWPERGSGLEELLHHADGEMYRSKRSRCQRADGDRPAVDHFPVPG